MRIKEMTIGTDYAVRSRYLGNTITRGRFVYLDTTGLRRMPFFMLVDPHTGKLLDHVEMQTIAPQNVLHTWDVQLEQRAERLRLITERQEADRRNAQAWKELLPRLHAVGLRPSGNSAYASHMSLRLSLAEMEEFLRWKEDNADKATDEEIVEARKMYGDDNVAIDPGASRSVGENGTTWVQAWVLIKDDNEEEQS